MSDAKEEESKKNSLFSKINSRDDAVEMVKSCAVWFYAIAGIQAAVGYFIQPYMIFDAVLYALFAGIMHKWFSRTAAIFLLLLGTAAAISTMLNRLGISDEGGRNIILALVVFWVSIRSVEATFKLHGRYALSES